MSGQVFYAGFFGSRVSKQHCTYDWNDKTPVAPLEKYEEWAAEHASKANPKMLRRVTIAIRNGTSKSEACRRCGLSVSTWNRMPDELK